MGTNRLYPKGISNVHLYARRETGGRGKEMIISMSGSSISDGTGVFIRYLL